MIVEEFVNVLESDFYVGVPDSQLRALCDWLIQNYGIGKKHIIAANEGNAVGLAAGYYLATGKVPVVYLQNSGLGNIINPVASLLNEKVYGIPCIFVVGWRGEPGVKDEPQHIYQGEITLDLLKDIGISTCVLEKESTREELIHIAAQFKDELKRGKSVAYVVKKGALENESKVKYENGYGMKREEILRCILEYTQDDIIVSTTGKTSRELFELRESRGETHERDFLTVGSMGHSSSIAMGLALEKPDKRIWCIDGDGAVIMHMGAMAVSGKCNLPNYVHILINNEAHESVGGMPTAANVVDFSLIAKGCGYQRVESVDNLSDLKTILREVVDNKILTFIEIKSGIGSRKDLGRPTISPSDNKKNFMDNLQR